MWNISNEKLSSEGKNYSCKIQRTSFKARNFDIPRKSEVTEKNNASVSSHRLCPLFLNKLHDPMYDVSL